MTFIHFETEADATAALHARQGYVVDTHDAGNTALALNFSSKFNPDNNKDETKPASEAHAAADGTAATTVGAEAEGTEVAGAPADADAGDDVDIENGTSAVGPHATPPEALEVDEVATDEETAKDAAAAAESSVANMLDNDEEEES